MRLLLLVSRAQFMGGSRGCHHARDTGGYEAARLRSCKPKAARRCAGRLSRA